mmetsp:Transcript_61193/g.176260  ORF Transcript_61193/g.176260 Transcript_61193/m.176260 type:complete len:191 (+) Transcript_61193:121-693(+)
MAAIAAPAPAFSAVAGPWADVARRIANSFAEVREEQEVAEMERDRWTSVARRVAAALRDIDDSDVDADDEAESAFGGEGRCRAWGASDDESDGVPEPFAEPEPEDDDFFQKHRLGAGFCHPNRASAIAGGYFSGDSGDEASPKLAGSSSGGSSGSTGLPSEVDEDSDRAADGAVAAVRKAAGDPPSHLAR